MKIAILAPILGCLAAFVSADAKTACGIKSPTAMHAIRNFCAKTDIVIPSQYAKWGKDGDNVQMHAYIMGNCNPKQWVPQKYCYSQFYDICARGGPHGGGTAKYGNNKCQTWTLHWSPTKPNP